MTDDRRPPAAPGRRCGPGWPRTPSPPSVPTRRTRSWPGSSSRCPTSTSRSPSCTAPGTPTRCSSAPCGSPWPPPPSVPPPCAGWTAAGRSTPAGSSAPGCRATSATSTGSAARSPSCPARLDYLGRAGHHLPAPHAPAPPAARGERRRLRGHGLPRRRSAAGHDGRPGGRRRRAARAGDEPLHRPRAQPHRARAPVGAGLAGRRSRVRRLLHRVPRPDDARRLRRDDPGGLPRPGARVVQLGARGRAAGPAAGSGRRSGRTSGTSTTRTPR